jgi:hypothetical protein
MSREPVKIIIEVNGGVVQAVYCGAEGRPLAQVVVVDHDNASVSAPPIQPLNEFHAADVKDYDRDVDADWVFG